MVLGTLFWFLMLVVPWECYGSCREDKTQEYVRVSPDYNEYGNYIEGRYEDKNMTLSCNEIFSIGQISYQHEESYLEKFLVISNSSLSSILSMEMYKFRDFITMKLSNIHIQTIAPGSFTDLSKLRELYLDNNELTVIQRAVFNALPALTILNLTNNNIANIEDLALAGLTSLTHLHLRNNNLTSISNNFFKGLDNLTYVDFTGNPLETFPFSQTPKLDTLLLSQTALTSMPDDMSNLTIKTFDLSLSQISKIDFCLFPKSDDIILTSNKIVIVNSCQDFDGVTLNLDDNEIEKMIGTFGKLSNLNLAHNKLQSIQKSMFGQPSTLLLLDLRSNDLSIFDKDFFHGFTSLRTLVLRNNKLSIINPILFRNLTRLKLLDLSANLIEGFQFGVFDSLTNLEVLNISDNKLTTLPPDRFHSTTSLLHLYFDNNRISSFEILGFASLETVSFDHNPWRCKDLFRISSNAKGRKVEISPGNSFDVENFHGIACVDSETKDMSLRQDLEEATSETVRNSKMMEVLDENFDKSKFVRFFDDDFSKSNFFKYLNNFKFVVEKKEVNGSKSEKLTAFQEVSNQEYYGLFIFMSIALALILLILVIVFVVFLFYWVKKLQKQFTTAAVSEMELC